MFGNYVYDKSYAQYSNLILLIDKDNLNDKMDYTSFFFAQSFEVIEYTNDLDFRIEHESKLNGIGNKIVIIANSEKYIPYDIRQKLHVNVVSYSNLFPKLNIDVLKSKSSLDLDLLSLAYKSNFEDRTQRKDTEKFFTEKVYTKNNVKEYLVHSLQKVMLKIIGFDLNKDSILIAEKETEYDKINSIDKKNTEYKNWFIIAEEKAKLEVLAVQYDIEMDTFEINNRFKNFILDQFGKLSQIIDRDTPVLISRAMEYMSQNSSRFIVIVMDGMSQFDWNIISQSFDGIAYKQAAAFAMIPTTTSISRQCLLSNKYPIQLLEPWKQSKEKAEFISCARAIGYTEMQVAYNRGYDSEFSSFVRCAAVIINDVDYMVHAQQLGRLGMFNDISVLAKQAKLADMARRFLNGGYDVYITSDHGNTPCLGLGKLMGTGVEVETKSRRMIVLKDFADTELLIEKYRLIEYPKYYLMKNYDYLMCDTGVSLDAKGKDVMSHGGITLDEVIVPFIKMKAENNNG